MMQQVEQRDAARPGRMLAGDEAFMERSPTSPAWMNLPSPPLAEQNISAPLRSMDSLRYPVLRPLLPLIDSISHGRQLVTYWTYISRVPRMRTTSFEPAHFGLCLPQEVVFASHEASSVQPSSSSKHAVDRCSDKQRIFSQFTSCCARTSVPQTPGAHCGLIEPLDPQPGAWWNISSRPNKSHY